MEHQIKLTVEKKVKDLMKDEGAKVDGQFVSELNRRVNQLVLDACGRARSNKRVIVKPCDL